MHELHSHCQLFPGNRESVWEKAPVRHKDRLLSLLCLSVKTILAQRKHLSSFQIDTLKESRINTKRWTCLYQHDVTSQTNAITSIFYPNVKFGFTYHSYTDSFDAKTIKCHSGLEITDSVKSKILFLITADKMSKSVISAFLRNKNKNVKWKTVEIFLDLKQAVL